MTACHRAKRDYLQGQETPWVYRGDINSYITPSTSAKMAQRKLSMLIVLPVVRAVATELEVCVGEQRETDGKVGSHHWLTLGQPSLPYRVMVWEIKSEERRAML